MTTSTADRLLALDTSADPVTAYLVAWIAFEHLVKVTAREAGVRTTFALRRNGTVQTRTVGHMKMPIVTPPRPESEVEAALARLSEASKDALLAHPAVRTFALRVPRFRGRPLPHDARGQRLSGVLDVALTPDARYPVWRPLDSALIRALDQGALTSEQRDTLVAQVVALLTAIRHNLLIDEEDGPTIAAHGLPLLQLLVDGLKEVA